MKIFQLEHPSEDVRSIQCLTAADRMFIVRLPDERVSSSWTPRRIDWVKDWPEGKPGQLVADRPAFGSGLALGRNAIDALSDLLIDNGEILPLDGLGGMYSVYHVLSISDALDTHASVGSWNEVENRFTVIWNPVFVAERCEDFAIFRVRQATSALFFVSETFVERVVERQLTGFKFKECDVK